MSFVVNMAGTFGSPSPSSLTISVDHDIVDGAPVARFAAEPRELLERGEGLQG